MLTQLISHIEQARSVQDRFVEVERKADTIPTTTKEIFDLLSLCRYRLDEKDFPALRQTEIFVAFAECKQILVENDGYFYI
jgi:hypothetical protein